MKKGDIVEKYMILRRIGSGGEGSVYLAVHLQTHQLRALKELPRSKGRASYHEVYVLRRMHHKRLPDMIDVLETDSSVILVMEYVRGQSLEQILQRKNRLSQQQVTEAALQVGEALSYLHSRTPPVLHLDIKPANIICRPDGTLVLVDYGAALRDASECEQGTDSSMDDAAGSLVHKGTDGYAAPELYSREGAPDVRTDLYELGALLYRMISGMTYSPVLYKGRVPGCSDGLSDVIRHCLAPEPAERFGNVDAFLMELKQYLRRGKREKSRFHVYGAILLSIFCLYLAVNTVSLQLETEGREAWNYERLVEEAGISPRQDSESLLKRAVFLKPEGEEAYLELLHLYAADSTLSQEEDYSLRELLHTVPLGQEETYEELLSHNPAGYGQVCCELGILYRFAYEETDSVRIAGGWFEKAEKAAAQLKSLPEWAESAAAYAVLCGTSEIEQLDRMEDPAAGMEDKWKKLQLLTEGVSGRSEETEMPGSLKARFWLWISEEALASSVYLPAEERSSLLKEMVGRIHTGMETVSEGMEKSDVLSSIYADIQVNLESMQLLADNTD